MLLQHRQYLLNIQITRIHQDCIDCFTQGCFATIAILLISLLESLQDILETNTGILRLLFGEAPTSSGLWTGFDEKLTIGLWQNNGTNIASF